MVIVCMFVTIRRIKGGREGRKGGEREGWRVGMTLKCVKRGLHTHTERLADAGSWWGVGTKIGNHGGASFTEKK